MRGPDVICFLGACQDASGGFGGGPGQLPHLAPTYAAVAALLSMGGEAALQAIDRRGVLRFIGSMCAPPEAGIGLSVCQGRVNFLFLCSKRTSGARARGQAMNAMLGHRDSVPPRLQACWTGPWH